MYSIYIAHFQDCSMRFTHYYPGRPYDHFIDHSQLPGKHARELPVRRVAYSFWQYRSLSIARYPLYLGGWPASGVNPRIRTHDPWILPTPCCSLNHRNRQRAVLRRPCRRHCQRARGMGHGQRAEKDGTGREHGLRAQSRTENNTWFNCNNILNHF